MTHECEHQAIVVGAGPAGLASALAFAHCGVATAVIGPLSDPHDGRTAALFDGSIAFLKRIGAWEAIEDQAEPITAIRLCDATGALVRAPEVTFWASEIGRDAFGYNVPTGGLAAALEHAAAGRVTRIVSGGVSSMVCGIDRVTIETKEGQKLSSPLVAGADGRGSLSRKAAGIETRAWSYPQAAVVATFRHTRPHAGISTELHRRSGPLTLVPMPGLASSLVWVEKPEEAERLAALSDFAFAAALAPHASGLLGTISGLSPRRVFHLSGQTAEVLGQNRIGLIGEAGHVIPPIGAQGLNLSLRDAATLAELAADAMSAGQDPGAPDVLAEYERRRRRDVSARVWTIDLMNRSLLSESAPVHFARGLGLAALKAVAPLRHLVMREGMTPSFATPRLMSP
ncbi:MAG: FAD-dependent monooxygenase [Hyphomicrobium sp.]